MSFKETLFELCQNSGGIITREQFYEIDKNISVDNANTLIKIFVGKKMLSESPDGKILAWVGPNELLSPKQRIINHCNLHGGQITLKEAIDAFPDHTPSLVGSIIEAAVRQGILCVISDGIYKWTEYKSPILF